MMNRIHTIKPLIFIVVLACLLSGAVRADKLKPDCPGLVSSMVRTTPEHFEFQHRSFASTFVTSILMFNATQALRSAVTGEYYFTRAFNITLPTDVLLTLTTHAVSLSNIKPLKHLLEGKFLGPKLEPHMKIFTNAMLGVAYIHGSWAASGVEITPIKACLSIGLCAVVYPTLYFVKTRLFKKLPLQRDRTRMKKFADDPSFGPAFKILAHDVALAARSAKISESDIELLTLTYIDNLLNDWPIEQRIIGTELQSAPEIKLLIEELSQTSSVWKIRRARRILIRQLVQMEGDPLTPRHTRGDILNILDLGSPFTAESSLRFHEAMQKRAQVQKLFVWGSSLLDQAVAVGIAGGVGMYYVNDYAVHH